MKPLNSPIWSMATILAAGLVAWGVAKYAIKPEHSHKQEHAEDHPSLHDWLHENLEISAGQEELLRPIELAFEADSEQCQDEIKAAGVALAEAIQNYPEDSSEIETARLRLHEAKGRLEEITLEHFFTMKQHLDPGQGEKLLEWTHDSLLHGLGR